MAFLKDDSFAHTSLSCKRGWASRTSGILPTWQKRVRTCLKHVRTTYVQCYSTSLLRTRVVHVHTFLKMYVHVHTFSEMYEHVRTVYVHGTYMFIYFEV